jgi:hypothetical protein
MRAAVLLTFEVEARGAPKNLEPGGCVATDLDLRLGRPKRVECLVEQVAYDAGLWHVPGRANVTNREVVVDPHVALDEAGDLPVVRRAIEAFQHQDVAAAGGAGVALAAALMVGVRQRRADGVAQRLGVA